MISRLGQVVLKSTCPKGQGEFLMIIDQGCVFACVHAVLIRHYTCLIGLWIHCITMVPTSLENYNIVAILRRCLSWLTTFQNNLDQLSLTYFVYSIKKTYLEWPVTHWILFINSKLQHDFSGFGCLNQLQILQQSFYLKILLGKYKQIILGEK